MFVQCLGSGDAFGSRGRFNTSFYLRTSTAGVLLDCGASTLIALKRENLSTEDVDVVLITHLHGDHFGGLPFMLCEIVALGTRSKPLTIIGPDETEARTRESLQCFYPGVTLESGPEIKFLHYQAGQPMDHLGMHVHPYKVVHSPDTNPHALRIEVDNITIAFSGDTEWTDELVKVSAGADLFICEATELRGHKKYHLSVDEVKTHLKKLSAKKVVLTHISEEGLDHLHEITLPTASDGAILLDDREARTSDC